MDKTEELFQAIDILVDKRVGEIQKDTTKVYTITDDSQRSQGIYQVTDGSITFEAIAPENVYYYRNDLVYVTIPLGDFTQEKLIIGKKKQEYDPQETERAKDEILSYQTFHLVTTAVGLEANGNETAVLVNSGGDAITAEELMPLGYTRLGVRAYFKTAIDDAVSGNYGLRLGINGGQYLEFDSSEMFGSLYNTAGYFPQTKIFDITDFNLNNIVIDLYQNDNFIDNDGTTHIAIGTENIFVKDIDIYLGYDEKSVPRGEQVKLYTEDSLNYGIEFRATIGDETTGSKQTISTDLKHVEVLWKHYDKTLDKFVLTNPSATYKWYFWCPNNVDDKAGINWKEMTSNSGSGGAKDLFNEYYTTSIKNTISTNMRGMGFLPTEVTLFINNPQIELTYPSGKDEFTVIYSGQQGGTDIPVTVTINSYRQDYINLASNTNYWDISGNTIVYRPNGVSTYDKIKAVVLITGTDEYYSSDIMAFSRGGLVKEFDIDEDTIRNVVNEELAEMSLPSADEIANLEAQVGSLSNKISIYNSGLEIIYTDSDPLHGSYFVYGLNNKIKDAAQASVIRKLGAALLNTNSVGFTGVTDGSKLYWRILQGDDLITVQEDQSGTHESTISGYYNGVTFDYKIKSYFSPAKTKTIIQCIYRNEVSFTSEGSTTTEVAYYVDTIELNFGYQSSNGSDYTAVLTMENFEALIKGSSGNEVRLRIYDSLGQQIDTTGLGISWNWYLLPLNTNTTNYVTLSYVNNSPICTLNVANNNNFNPIKNMCILQANITGLLTYTLTTYLPIPCATRDGLQATGPRSIWYTSEGYPEVDTRLSYSINTSTSGASWRIKYLKYSSGTTIDASDIAIIGLPTLSNKNNLVPASVYVDDVAAIATVYYSTSQSAALWSCPILIYKNQYASDTLNKWDGSTQINLEDNGKILTSYVAAGKKESDNTFTGVVMGDVSTRIDNNDLTQLGLYGISHGIIAYAFKEDGTAFIGASGSGRIVFDGTNATIASADYAEDPSTHLPTAGMQIDLNNGTIKAKYLWLQDKIGIDDSGQVYIKGDTNIIINNNTSTLGGEITGLKNQGTSFSNSISVLDGKITELENQDDNFSNSIDTIEETIVSLQNSGIEAKVTQILTNTSGEEDEIIRDEDGKAFFSTVSGKFDSNGLTIKRDVSDNIILEKPPTQSILNWEGLRVYGNRGFSDLAKEELLMDVRFDGVNIENLFINNNLNIGHYLQTPINKEFYTYKKHTVLSTDTFDPNLQYYLTGSGSNSTRWPITINNAEEFNDLIASNITLTYLTKTTELKESLAFMTNRGEN